MNRRYDKYATYPRLHITVFPMIHICQFCNEPFCQEVVAKVPRFCGSECQAASYRKVRRRYDQIKYAKEGCGIRPHMRIDEPNEWGDYALRKRMERENGQSRAG